MDPPAAEALINLLSPKLLLSNYAMTVAIVVEVYDYILNFHLEFQLIWLSPWGYTKLLYLITRYLPLGSIYANYYVSYSLNSTSEHCQAAYFGTGWAFVLAFLSAEAALMIRTWAVWGSNRILGFVLLGSWIGMMISEIVLAVTWTSGIRMVPIPFPEFPGCFVSANLTQLQMIYLILTLLDAGVFALMLISAYRSYLCWGPGSKLSIVIHRDGVLFYIYLLAITIASFVSVSIVPGYRAFVMTPMHAALYSVLTCRMILNIRRAARRHLHFSSLHEITRPDDLDEMSLSFFDPERSRAGSAEGLDQPEIEEGDHTV